MPSKMRFLAVMPVVVLALGGCDKSAPVPAGKAAGAQVLPGSISDGMVDLDQSQSHPLLNPDQSKHATAGEIMGDDGSDTAKEPVVAPEVAVPVADKPAGAAAE